MSAFVLPGTETPVTTSALVVATAAAVGATALLVSYARTANNKRDADDAAPHVTIHEVDSALPLLGSLLDVVKHGDTFHDWVLAQSVKLNGEPWRMRVPGQPDTVFVCNPEAVDDILTKQFDKFPKGNDQIALLQTMFGRGLLASDGERWHHQRKTAAKFFSANVLRSFLKQSIHKSWGRIVEILTDAATKGEYVDVKKMFHDFTLDTFVEMALGVDLNCISASEPHPFQAALDAASPVTSLRFRRPMWYWNLEHKLRVGREGVLARSMDVIYEWLNDVVQQSIDKCVAAKDDAKDPLAVKSVVELFFESSRDGVDGLQKEDLVDFVLTFVIAARDTTADTLSWFFYLLEQHPEVEANIRDEMKTKLSTVEATTYLTTDHTRDLLYLEATIKETLRLYPAAPFTFRRVNEDATIGGGIHLREGETVVTPAFTMARLPLNWGPDAAEFKPERWIDEASGTIRQFPSSKFFSFSSGPRTCIGMNLALLELRVLAANLLHRFKLRVDLSSNDGSYVMSPTMTMKNPLLVRASVVHP